MGGQVDEEASASGAGLVTEHREGCFGDDPSFRHRIDEADGAELRYGRGRPHQRRRVATSLGATRRIEQHRQAPRVTAVVEGGRDADREVESRARCPTDRGTGWRRGLADGG